MADPGAAAKALADEVAQANPNPYPNPNPNPNQVILLLLAHGADVESMPRSLPHQTPLLLAASCRQEQCLLALLEAR